MTTGFFNSQFGGSVASAINPASSGSSRSCVDSWVMIGIESQNVGDEVAISTVARANLGFQPCIRPGDFRPKRLHERCDWRRFCMLNNTLTDCPMRTAVCCSCRSPRRVRFPEPSTSKFSRMAKVRLPFTTPTNSVDGRLRSCWNGERMWLH